MGFPGEHPLCLQRPGFLPDNLLLVLQSLKKKGKYYGTQDVLTDSPEFQVKGFFHIHTTGIGSVLFLQAA